MRYYWLALISLVAATAGATAQQPPATGQAAPDRLGTFLNGWEKSMKGLQTLSAQCVRTDKNKTFGSVDVYTGVAKFMRPGYALLEMERKDRPRVLAEKFVCTGTFIYQFVPQQKEIRVYELPGAKQGQAADDGFLSFLFGMNATDARQRYDLKLVKDDQYYIYVEILPRTNADKAEFRKARLVLNRESYLPRQLWFESPNGDEATWDIPRIESNPPLDRQLFKQPDLPPGWKQVKMPGQAQDAPPRVYRPQK